MGESERQRLEREMRERESLENERRKEKNAERVIRGASAGLGAGLAWLIFSKDERTQEEKDKANEEWEKNGCTKGCVWIVIAVIIVAIMGHMA